MPNGSGFYAIKKIQDLNSKAKIITITEDTSSTTQEKLDKLTVPLIQKPFKMEQVILAINQ